MGDTVTYVFDGQGRANGPSLRGGGPMHSRVPVWTALAGALSTLTDTVATPTGFTPLKYDRNWVVDDPQPAGSPVWIEQRGGFHVDSLKDSLLYDGWNRVIAVVSFRNAAVIVRDSFAFDRAGNLKTTAGAEVYDATTDRLTGRAGSGCTWSDSYDRAGNLTQAVCGSTTWSFGYTALNQLRTVKQNGTLIARYGYDVLGRRIAKRVYSAATGGTVAYTRFVYHGAHVAFETDSAGTTGLRYTWGLATDDVLAIRDAAGNHYYVVQDLLSSVRGLVKRDGTWVRSLQYGAYGAVLRDTASASAPTWELRYRWTGREYDAETGWYFFRSRSYDPAARRFVQEDAIGYAGSANVYAYGDGAPLDGRDPSGLRMDQIALYMKYGGPGGGGEFVRPGGGYGGRGNTERFSQAWGDWFGFGAFDLRTTLEYRADMVDYYNAMGAAQQAVDCSRGGCPTPGELRANAALTRSLQVLFAYSQKVHKEVGAYIVLARDGSARIGRSGTGIQGEFDFLRILGPMPANTIAWFHTHPDEGSTVGGSWNATDIGPPGLYSIVMNRYNMWFITPWESRVYCYRDSPGFSCAPAY